jgi:NAD(P) transhydrogenase subunit alpha
MAIGPRNAIALALAVVLALIGFTAESAPIPHFVQQVTVFVLACFIGWQVVWSVTPALHTPLMSVTNAISGIIVVGGLLGVAGAELNTAAILGAVAILVASINIAGGFLVTQRMLQMFRKEGN